MNRISLLGLLLTLFAIIPEQPAIARRTSDEKPPKALLVELLTRQSQVSYMQQRNTEKAMEVRMDVQGVMKATLMDFSTNFEFCPVYFFVDSNADLVKQGKFDGILLDKDMRPVHQSLLQEGDTSFFIAYYGSYIPQPTQISPSEWMSNNLGPYRESFGDDPTSLKPTLLVMDHNFELLRLPRPRTVRGYVGRSRRQYKNLYYRSRHYDIDYTPLAATYDDTIERYYRKLAQRRNKNS